MTGQLPASGCDCYALNLNACDVFRPLHGLSNRFRGLVQIDNCAVLNAPRLNIANACGRQRAIGPSNPVRFHDEAGDFGRPQIHGGHHGLATKRSGQAFTAFSSGIYLRRQVFDPYRPKRRRRRVGPEAPRPLVVLTLLSDRVGRSARIPIPKAATSGRSAQAEVAPAPRQSPATGSNFRP